MQFGPQIESATAARAAGGARRGSARPGPGLSERCAQHSEKLLLQPFSDVCRPFRLPEAIVAFSWGQTAKSRDLRQLFPRVF